MSAIGLLAASIRLINLLNFAMKSLIWTLGSFLICVSCDSRVCLPSTLLNRASNLVCMLSHVVMHPTGRYWNQTALSTNVSTNMRTATSSYYGATTLQEMINEAMCSSANTFPSPLNLGKLFLGARGRWLLAARRRGPIALPQGTNMALGKMAGIGWKVTLVGVPTPWRVRESHTDGAWVRKTGGEEDLLLTQRIGFTEENKILSAISSTS